MLTPWYVGITATPANYGRAADAGKLLSLEHHFQPEPGAFDPDPLRAWWKFKTLVRRVDEDYARRAPAVQAAWTSLENRLFSKQAAVEAEALRLWSKDPDAARAYLTQYCGDVAAEACAQADRLCDSLQSAAGR